MSKKRPPLTNEDGEVRELTKEDLARMRPFKEVLPDLYESLKRSGGRPRLVETKKSITARLDPDIVAWLKQGGRGYQTRLNKILREVMEKV